MKYSIVALFFMLTGCAGVDQTNDLLGIYTTHYENEFGVFDDTLVLQKANEKNIYIAVKKIGSIRQLDGKIFPREWRTELWTLDYNEDKQTLFDLRRGKTLIWNRSKSTIQSGSRIYLKL